jgi:hypothetical protein
MALRPPLLVAVEHLAMNVTLLLVIPGMERCVRKTVRAAWFSVVEVVLLGRLVMVAIVFRRQHVLDLFLLIP